MSSSPKCLYTHTHTHIYICYFRLTTSTKRLTILCPLQANRSNSDASNDGRKGELFSTRSVQRDYNWEYPSNRNSLQFSL
jgi:hypothetical protein